MAAGRYKYALTWAERLIEQRTVDRIKATRSEIKRLELEALARKMDDPNATPRDLTKILYGGQKPSWETPEIMPRTAEVMRDLAAGDFLSAVEDTAITVLSAAVAYDKIFNEPWTAFADAAVRREAWELAQWATSPATEIKIPAGTKWTEGPCGTYVDLGLSVNYKYPQYCGVCTFNGAAPDYTGSTDAEINFALSSGSVIGLWHKEPYGLVPGTWAYSGFGMIQAINPANFEPWDSSVHGLYGPAAKSVPSHFGVDDALWFDPLNHRLSELGLSKWQTPDQMWKHIEDMFGPPSKWSREGLWWRAPSTEKFPWWKHKPIPEPASHVPPALSNKGSETINKFTNRNKGFRKPPEKHVKEVKPKGERALWRALNAAGKYSEFQDAAKALYKGLPKELRREIWLLSGRREPRPEEKVLWILTNLDKMDWGEGITHLVVSQIDDLIAAYTTHDNLFRSIHRRFSGRMLSRSAWNEMVEGHPELQSKAPSLEKWLEDNGLLGK